MKQAVIQTSIDTYYSIDLSTVRGKVAAEIRRLTRAGHPAYISLVAHNLGMEKSTVSGRFNELKQAPFQVNGGWFRMEPTGERLLPIPGDNAGRHRRVETWAIINCTAPVEQKNLFG